jgi:hypothetical protein
MMPRDSPAALTTKIGVLNPPKRTRNPGGDVAEAWAGGAKWGGENGGGRVLWPGCQRHLNQQNP